MKRCAFRLIFLVPLVLSACDVLAPRDIGNENRFNLHVTIDQQDQKPRLSSLTVQLPNASPVLDTYKISVLLADGRQDYVDGARWSDFLPSLVQTSLRDGFSHSGSIKQVNDDTDGLGGSYLLSSEIQNFSIVYAQGNKIPSVHVRMIFGVKRAENGKVIRRFTVDKTQTASENSLAAIRSAYNQAFSDLAADALKQTVQIEPIVKKAGD